MEVEEEAEEEEGGGSLMSPFSAALPCSAAQTAATSLHSSRDRAGRPRAALSEMVVPEIAKKVFVSLCFYLL